MLWVLTNGEFSSQSIQGITNLRLWMGSHPTSISIQFTARGFQVKTTDWLQGKEAGEVVRVWGRRGGKEIWRNSCRCIAPGKVDQKHNILFGNSLAGSWAWSSTLLASHTSPSLSRSYLLLRPLSLCRCIAAIWHLASEEEPQWSLCGKESTAEMVTWKKGGGGASWTHWRSSIPPECLVMFKVATEWWCWRDSSPQAIFESVLVQICLQPVLRWMWYVPVTSITMIFCKLASDSTCIFLKIWQYNF